ncbi:MAG: hypothetical protein OSJ34_01010 [Muribaculaceae bacterium]|jgi:tetratricopeptide (TPR) repeat protein|nr:hypothetical protein [Muribaculaceae bacterium]
MTRRLIILITVITSWFTITAQSTLEEAKQLVESGDLETAIPMLEELAAASPKKGDINLLLGTALYYAGDHTGAKQQWEAALSKKVNAANLKLAELALMQYRTDDAEEFVETYRNGLKRGRKVLGPDESGDIDDRISRVSAMLDRVEKLVIIDSINVDSEIFFRQYGLAKSTGRFMLPSEAFNGTHQAAEPTVVFETGDGRERIWAVQNADNNFELVSAGPLSGGKWDEPSTLGSHLNEGGDANYPFLMSDGMTLYFANDGENSIGGLDIFITRRDGDGFLQPTNIGLPYNSPYNDYLLAIDEEKGIGWWATDRNRIPDMVTVYVFIPSDMRVNYPVDSENLAERALITSYRDTWEDGKDYSGLIALARKGSASDNGDLQATPQFALSVPGRGTLTSLQDFRNTRARGLAKQWLDLRSQLDRKKTELAALRERYRKGDQSVSGKILDGETVVAAMRNQLNIIASQVAEAEK